jgi:hypothetical protein
VKAVEVAVAVAVVWVMVLRVGVDLIGDYWGGPGSAPGWSLSLAAQRLGLVAFTGSSPADVININQVMSFVHYLDITCSYGFAVNT